MSLRRLAVGRRAQIAAAKVAARPVLMQCWLDLGFLHFAYDPEMVTPLLPMGVEIDTFPDASGFPKAWVGIVGFRIAGARPPFAPPLPLLSGFQELNVRTYARHEKLGPGVVFLSLDAPSRIVAAIAWPWFKVRYRRADPLCVRNGSRVSYASQRDDWKPASTRIEARVLPGAASAAPASLEHFLTERYRYFSGSGSKLWSGRVRHEPYLLNSMHVEYLRTTHLAALGLPEAKLAHACYCKGVSSEFFPVEVA
jgi:uncharacterized protein YqjF (DUF2071 family)